jgi:hypothetical protein
MVSVIREENKAQGRTDLSFFKKNVTRPATNGTNMSKTGIIFQNAK